MWVQISLSCALLAIASATRGFGVPIVLGGVLMVWWLGINRMYARALGGKERSPRRALGDRRVTVQSLIGTTLPVATGLIAWVVPEVHLVESATWSTALAAAACIPWAMYMSSLVDWYYIRPRLDGIVCAPPCRPHDKRASWLLLTRVWFLHRWRAALSVGVAALVTLTALVLALLDAGDAEVGEGIWAVIAAAFTAGVGAVALLFHDWIAEMRVCTKWALWLDKPPFLVGDELVGDEKVSGYLRDVSAIRATLVRGDPDSGRPRAYAVKLSDLQSSTATWRSPTHCAEGCGGVNRDQNDAPDGHQCEWDPVRLAAKGQRRRFIV